MPHQDCARFRTQRGSAVVELAMTLPVLALLVLAIARFGITFNNYIALTDAVRAGARQLATGRSVANPCQAATNRVHASAPSLKSATLPVTIAIGGAVSGNSCSNSALFAGEDVTVSATYPCNLTFYGITFGPAVCNLSASTTARVE